MNTQSAQQMPTRSAAPARGVTRATIEVIPVNLAEMRETIPSLTTPHRSAVPSRPVELLERDEQLYVAAQRITKQIREKIGAAKSMLSLIDKLVEANPQSTPVVSSSAPTESSHPTFEENTNRCDESSGAVSASPSASIESALSDEQGELTQLDHLQARFPRARSSSADTYPSFVSLTDYAERDDSRSPTAVDGLDDKYPSFVLLGDQAQPEDVCSSYAANSLDDTYPSFVPFEQVEHVVAHSPPTVISPDDTYPSFVSLKGHTEPEEVHHSQPTVSSGVTFPTPDLLKHQKQPEVAAKTVTKPFKYLKKGQRCRSTLPSDIAAHDSSI